MERSTPDYWHGVIQGLIFTGVILADHRRQLFPSIEVRLRIAPELIRIPDMAIFLHGHPAERFPSTPPFEVVEIVSQDDRYTDLMDKLHEYAAWGVPHIWVVNPQRRDLATFAEGILRSVQAFTLPGFDLNLTPTDLFDVS